jgi:MEDS: MEthanogen/methylotroph, DcmR Sensory domain
MSSCPDLLDHLEAEEHVVQLYGNDDRLLARNVCRYLEEGLKRGDGILVIATAEHRSSFVRHLARQPRYSAAVLEGSLVFLDAATTLGRFMVDGIPDAALFTAVVGEALRKVRNNAGQTGVRAYGEMVGLLWLAGNTVGANRLEELWNHLLRSSNTSLFCAYPIDVFSPDFEMNNVDAVLCSHTHLLPVDPALQSALSRAMDEVLGSRATQIRRLFQPNHRPSWAAIPAAEALVLWLRNNLPGSAQEILERARRYYQPLAESS